MTIIPPAADTGSTADLDALWAQLDAALDVDEERWNPAPGDKLLGTVAALDLLPGQDGAYYVVRVDTTDGRRVSFAASRARLRGQLAAAKVQPGDRLGIKYRGEQVAESSGRSFHDYSCVVQPVGPRDPERLFQFDPPNPGPVDDLLPEPEQQPDTPPF